MQKSDREFIEKYKQKQFQMRHPAPEVVAPVIVNVVSKETTKKTFQEVVQEVVQESSAQEVVQEVVQEAAAPVASAQEVVQKDINDALQLVNDLNIDANPLELIKSALQQINYALRLLEKEKKKEQIVVEQSEQEADIVVKKSEQEAVIVVEQSEQEAEIVVKKSEQEADIVVEQSEQEADIVVEQSVQEAPIQHPVPASAELVSIDHISDVDVDEEKEEEFKIVMPKKLKNKKVAITTVLPVQEKAKKDDFPSLGSIESSFTPFKKNGFWGGESKKSLEIAKAIAHIPSPTPVSSPSPNLKKSIRMVRGGPAYDDSEDEYLDGTEEYHFRKRGGNDDE